MAMASYVIALSLRLGSLDSLPDDRFYLSAATFTVVAAVIFRFSNMYRGVWRYASIEEIIQIKLNAEEQAALNKSAEDVKGMIGKLAL